MIWIIISFSIFYLTGYILAYVLIKKSFIITTDLDWTKGDRLKCLYFSLYSWVTVLVAIIMIIDFKSGDERASW